MQSNIKIVIMMLMLMLMLMILLTYLFSCSYSVLLYLLHYQSCCNMLLLSLLLSSSMTVIAYSQLCLIVFPQLPLVPLILILLHCSTSVDSPPSPAASLLCLALFSLNNRNVHCHTTHHPVINGGGDLLYCLLQSRIK